MSQSISAPTGFFNGSAGNSSAAQDLQSAITEADTTLNTTITEAAASVATSASAAASSATAAAGAFSNITSTLAAPSPIGATTPNTGSFTTLTAIGTATLNGILTSTHGQNVTSTLTPFSVYNATLSGTLTTGNAFAFSQNIADYLDARVDGGLNAVYFLDAVGAGAGGGRNGLLSQLVINGTVLDGSGNNNFYNAISASCYASKNMGGTSSLAGGNLLAFTGESYAASGGTYIGMVGAIQVGAGVMPGGSASNVGVIQISPLAGGIHPSNQYDGLAFGSVAGTLGFDRGINFGSQIGNALAVAPTGTLVGCTVPNGSPSMAMGSGIDFSALAFSSYFLKSVGFTVDGSGNLTAAKIISTVLAASTSYANDSAAATGGVAIGQFYRNGSAVMIRVS